VLDDDSVAPTSLQVSQGKNSLGEGAFKKGNVKAAAFERNSIAIDGLAASETYILAATLKGSDGKFSNVRTLRFSTRDEASMGESWIRTFSVGTVTQVSAVLSVSSSEKGTFYWTLVESSSGAPSQANIAGGKNKDGDAAVKSGSLELERNKTQTIEITGLKSGTSCTVYGYVSKSETEFSTVQSRSFSTTGIDTPSISKLTAAFKTDGAMPAEMDITVTVNEAGTIHWIIVEESGSALQPTPENVKNGNGTGDLNRPVYTRGSSSLPKGESTILTGGALNTKYRVYACMEGASGALSRVVSSGIFEKVTEAGGLTGLGISAGGKAISGFTFKADADDQTYTGATAPNGTSFLAVRPSAASSVDIIVDGSLVSRNSSHNVEMPARAGTPREIVIKTSEAGKSTRTYTIEVTENPLAVKTVYVSGVEPPELSADASGNYAVTVPGDYKEVNIAITFEAEMKGALILLDENAKRIAVKSGERKPIRLDSTETRVDLEISGPSNGGDPPETRRLTITKAP
jgi:hypothetical protein